MIYLQMLNELPAVLYRENDPVLRTTKEYFGVYGDEDNLLAVVGVMPHGSLTATATLWFALMPDTRATPRELRWAKDLCRLLLQCLPYDEVRAECDVDNLRNERFLRFLGFRFAGTISNRHIFVGDK